MTLLKDMKIHHPKILMYGRAGTGKTAFALTLGKELQLMDLDNGFTTGKTLKDKFTDARMMVDVVPGLIENDVNKGVAFLKAKTHLLSVVTQCRNKVYPFKALCVDSLTSLMDSAMRWVVGNAGRLGQNPQLQDWGLAFNEMENFLTILRSLPLLIIVTAHQHEIEIDKVVKVQIAVPGKKLPGKICGWFDEVWRLQIQNLQAGATAHTIQTKGTASTLARSRFNVADKLNTTLGLKEILKGVGYEF